MERKFLLLFKGTVDVFPKEKYSSKSLAGRRGLQQDINTGNMTLAFTFLHKKYAFEEDVFNSFQSTDRLPFLSGKAAQIYKFTIMLLIKLSEVILVAVLIAKSCLTLLRHYGL